MVLQVLGDDHRSLISCISGPSHAEELIQQLPTSVVGSSYDLSLMHKVVELFGTPFFRVYPNADINGVAFGGAMKNIIAIACGISDGLGFGDNTKAALMTRGLHEIRKLSVTKACKPETLNRLLGLGDLCVTAFLNTAATTSLAISSPKGSIRKEPKEKEAMVGFTGPCRRW